ncbi:choice-of-anchor J domain-containing protein [uncultured Prevotella sp.]|uniref:choice-of-anchor J domain-containing protein n=1 Tax=uncultured Prevotella sp. TaxID=159272 RepID=UPI0025947B9C|nr:choice-of-anchor J domain-containing protein [uncultured Prevotella sp.]
MRKTLLRTFGLLFFALLGVMTGNAQNSFPYAVDFMTATDLSGWTVVDNSTAPGVSWEWGKGYKTKTADNEVLDNNMCAGIKDDTSEFNDYLVSPAFQLTKGNTYYISVRGQKRGYQFLDVEVGKSATDMSENKVVKDNIDTDLGQWARGWYELRGHCYAQTVTVEYTATETGTFHFSLRARSAEGDTNADLMAFMIYDIAINELDGGPQAMPYSINFAEHQRGWKAVDNSSTPYKTWGVDTFYDANSQNNYTAVMPMYDGDYEWNDYYISPLFTLEAGKSYKVKSCTWKNMDPSEFNLALMLGKSQKDASAFQKISDINMQLNYDANVTDDHVFAVEETGDYRLAYLATTAAATNQKIALTNFEIEETTETPEVTIGKIEETPEPVDVPYNVVFNAETNDWTTIDASSEATATWSYDADGFWDKELFASVGCYAMPEYDTAGPNDYLVSPGIKLEAGKTYTVKTTTGKLYSTPTVLSLEMATSNTDATAFNKVSDIEMADNQVQYINSFDVTVEADGVYYLAFHALNTSEESPTWGNVYAMSFSIDEKAEAQPVATTAVTDFTAKEAGDLKTINLKWKNPTKDVDGNDLAADAELSVKVFEGETLLTTVAGAPGAEGSYSYKPETYAGLHEYKIVVVYNELESEAATASVEVEVDGINGVVVIPAGAEVSVRTLGGALVGNNLSTLAKGTYLVTVKTVDGKVKTMKVTK